MLRAVQRKFPICRARPHGQITVAEPCYIGGYLAGWLSIVESGTTSFASLRAS